MQNEEKSKKSWQTPECIDLDVDKTSGKYSAGGEGVGASAEWGSAS